MENSELMHYGIIGMKWGVRRYQNGDGSLTEAGKDRYGAQGIGKKVASGIKKASEWKRLHTITGRPTKNPKHLTDAELKARIDRLRNEEEFRKLSGKKTKAQKVEARLAAGRAFATAFMAKIGGRVGGIGTNINKTIGDIGTSINKKIGDKFLKSKLQSEKDEKDFWVAKKETLAAKDEFDKDQERREKEKEAKKYSDVDKWIEEARQKAEYEQIGKEIDDAISDVRNMNVDDLKK